MSVKFALRAKRLAKSVVSSQNILEETESRGLRFERKYRKGNLFHCARGCGLFVDVCFCAPCGAVAGHAKGVLSESGCGGGRFPDVTAFRGPFRIGKGNRTAVFLRSLIGMLGVIANFWAIDHLPIADSTMLNKMSPFLQS